TRRGATIPCRLPSALIHPQRLLWMWAAIIRTVCLGTPGTSLLQTAAGKCSTRYVVARLVVRQAWISPSPFSAGVLTFRLVTGGLDPRAFNHQRHGPLGR